MRIGIDCRTILNPKYGEKAGVGHYTYYLVKNLLKIDKKNQYILFFDHRFKDVKELQKKNVEIVRFPWSEYKKYMPLGYSHYIIANVLAKANLDVFHAPANIMPLGYKKPTVLTVHDLAIYQNPEWFPPKQKFSVKISVPKSIGKAKKIIAISESTKKSLISQFNLTDGKIKVVYEGFTKEKPCNNKVIKRTLKKYKTGEKYILFLGTLEPRKNVPALIQAFDNLVKENYKKYKDYQLIIAGAKGWKYEPIIKAIKEIKYSRVRYLGYISIVEKMALLSKATCFVFPTLWEGFGLPVLEAMGFGIPVITSNISSLPEVVEKAGILVNPEKSESIKAGLKKLLSNKATLKRYSKKAKQQAKKFSWQKCAKETFKIYKEAAI
ncbi:MAG: glycosyltransferase family 1 protein [Patescibacteria group bacterium]|jgi:glycosyltransferase involved in cell wall biosynthesis